MRIYTSLLGPGRRGESLYIYVAAAGIYIYVRMCVSEEWDGRGVRGLRGKGMALLDVYALNAKLKNKELSFR